MARPPDSTLARSVTETGDHGAEPRRLGQVIGRSEQWVGSGEPAIPYWRGKIIGRYSRPNFITVHGLLGEYWMKFHGREANQFPRLQQLQQTLSTPYVPLKFPTHPPSPLRGANFGPGQSYRDLGSGRAKARRMGRTG